MKNKIYIILTALCLLGIILIQNFAGSPPARKEFNFILNKEKLINNPYTIILGILLLLYLILFFSGLINLIIFGLRKLSRKDPLPMPKEEKKIPLSYEKMIELLLLISFLTLIMHLAPVIINIFKKEIKSINLILSLNMALQIGIIILILKYINLKFLGFHLNRRQIIFLLRIYTATLPLIIASLLLNIFLIKKLSLEYSPSLAIELFLLLKDKISLSILIIQVIILAPLAEELFFRGLIYKLCRKKYSFMISAFLVSLIFALIHQNPQNILPLFVISLSLCYSYEKTQKVLAPIAFHSLHNCLSLFFLLTMKNLL